jgi:hypothetical protein
VLLRLLGRVLSKFNFLVLFRQPDASIRHFNDEIREFGTGKSHELATPPLDIYVR